MVSEELSSVETLFSTERTPKLLTVSEELSSVETKFYASVKPSPSGVSEELSSVETPPIMMDGTGVEPAFQKNLVVWKLS